MKHLHALGLTLVLLCVCTLAVVQPATAQDNKKVVIIRKSIDQDGQKTVEKTVTTGDDADRLLKEMNEGDASHEVDVMVLRHGDVIGDNEGGEKDVTVNVEEIDGDRVITITTDGQTETIHLAPGDELSEADKQRLVEQGIFINEGDHHVVWDGDTAQDFDFDFNFDGLAKGLRGLSHSLAHIGDGHGWAIASTQNINCAALGVYVSTSDPEGVLINNTIGSSGAEEAGLKSGDIITALDETPTPSFGELHEVLSHHIPGDVVSVTYLRNEVESRTEVQLRAWKDFPSFANSRHALVTCDDKDQPEQITRKIIVIKKDKAQPEDPMTDQVLSVDNVLDLPDFVAFPNPTDGRFRVQFSADAVPTIVSVYDVSGKEVFRDNLDEFDGYYNKEIDLRSQARGVMILSVEQGSKTFTEQIVTN